MVNASAMPSGSAEEDGAFVFGSSRALERQVLGPLEEGIVGVLVVVEWAVERSALCRMSNLRDDVFSQVCPKFEGLRSVGRETSQQASTPPWRRFVNNIKFGASAVVGIGYVESLLSRVAARPLAS